MKLMPILLNCIMLYLIMELNYIILQKKKDCFKFYIRSKLFENFLIGTKTLDPEYLIKFRRKIMLLYHSRPSYIFKKMKEVMFNPRLFKNYLTFGIKILKSNIRFEATFLKKHKTIEN